MTDTQVFGSAIGRSLLRRVVCELVDCAEEDHEEFVNDLRRAISAAVDIHKARMDYKYEQNTA